jgi:hypothetical protein
MPDQRRDLGAPGSRLCPLVPKARYLRIWLCEFRGLIRSGGAAVVFTFVYWLTGSIWPGIVIHALVEISHA